jgi:hypothetical protein
MTVSTAIGSAIVAQSPSIVVSVVAISATIRTAIVAIPAPVRADIVAICTVIIGVIIESAVVPAMPGVVRVRPLCLGSGIKVEE